MSLFVTFEGIEGSGKSSHARTVAETLRSAGRVVVETREPGGTPAGTAIRSLLLGAEATPLTPLAELFLYCADRTQHVAQVIRPDGLYQSQTRFGMYRWHVMDPVRFEQDLRVTIQALGWRVLQSGQARYLPLQDDISSTALWYQREPHAPFPTLPERNFLEVV